jgi:hypothetical protein
MTGVVASEFDHQDQELNVNYKPSFTAGVSPERSQEMNLEQVAISNHY